MDGTPLVVGLLLVGSGLLLVVVARARHLSAGRPTAPGASFGRSRLLGGGVALVGVGVVLLTYFIVGALTMEPVVPL